MAARPDAIIEEVKAAGLRGRGGAGFPTGRNGPSCPRTQAGKPNFLVINADESEPGTQGPRDNPPDPHQLIEGALIAGYAIRARAAYIYIRGEFIRETERSALAVAGDL